MKQKGEIREEMLQALAQKTGINITEEGSIAIAIVDALLEEIVSLYDELENIRDNAYLSTATGNYIDRIGELVNTKRLEEDDESDEEYKLRISKAVLTHAKGNRIAIEEAIWGVPGVAGFDYRPYGQGTGSFTVYVYPRPGVNQTRLLDRVEAALLEVVAEGIRYEVKAAKEKRVDLAIVLQMKDGLGVMEKQDIRISVRNALVQYLNNIKKGEVLYVNELIRRAMGVHPDILDLGIIELKIGGIQKSISNTFPETDTRFVAGTVTIL